MWLAEEAHPVLAGGRRQRPEAAALGAQPTWLIHCYHWPVLLAGIHNNMMSGSQFCYPEALSGIPQCAALYGFMLGAGVWQRCGLSFMRWPDASGA